MDNSHDIAVGYSKSSGRSCRPSGSTGVEHRRRQYLGHGRKFKPAGRSAGHRHRRPRQPPGRLQLDDDRPVDQCLLLHERVFEDQRRIQLVRTSRVVQVSHAGRGVGTVSGRSRRATGTPVSGVVVALNNGFAAPSDASGALHLVPAGSYTASAIIPTTSACATSASVNPTRAHGDQNFCVGRLEARGDRTGGRRCIRKRNG
jgi:hypothetical protein